MSDAQEPFAVRLWRMGVGRALPIDPATDNIPMTAAQLREFQEQAHVDALIYTSGHRSGMEAAARVAEEYDWSTNALDIAAAIRREADK